MKMLMSNLIDALKAHPLVLAIVTINLCFLVAISMATMRKDALLADVVKTCVVQK